MEIDVWSAKKLKESFLAVFSGQFMRFIIVGLLNTTFSYFVYAVLVLIHTPYIMAGVGQAILGLLFSFKTTKKFVFKGNSKVLFLKFIIGYTALSTLYVLGLRLAHQIYDNSYIDGLLVLIPYVFLSFYVNKKFIFEDGKAK